MIQNDGYQPEHPLEYPPEHPPEHPAEPPRRDVPRCADCAPERPDSAINIVPAAKENIGQILEIGKESISADWTIDTLLPEINKAETYFIAAERGGETLGFAVFREVGGDGELLQIATRKDARLSGIGSVLLEAALKYAHDKSLDKVFLEVRRSNRAAIGLYEKFGFKTLRVRKGYYNNPIEDALVMELENDRSCDPHK